MDGDVGAVAKLLNTVASWVLSPDGYAAWKGQREREQVERDATKAIQAGDWERVNDRIAHLKRM